MSKLIAIAIPWATILALGTGVRAGSDVDAKARAQYRQAIELFEEGKYDQAAAAFETAYQMKPSYRILFNLAQAENQNGSFAAALGSYTRYLADGGEEIPAARREMVNAEIDRLSNLVGTLLVRCGTDGAAVFVDGRRQGTTPLDEPLFVDLGDREVTLKMGAETLHREVMRIRGGEQTVIEIDVGSPSETPAGSGDPPVGSEGKRVWTWVALGVGGAAAVGAAVTGGLALRAMSDLEDACPGSNCPASKQSDIDRGRNLALTADVLMGVAAAGIVTGVVLFFVEPKRGEREVVLAPAASPNGAGLSLSGRF